MANTSSRMLQLLSLLQNHRFWPGGELAGKLEVSERTLRRDIDRLRVLGYPVDANRGVAGGYQLRSGAAMPPLLLDDEEAVAIAVGLRTAAGGAVEGIEETSVRALAKVVQVMPPRLRRRVDALQTYTTVPAGGSRGPRVDPTALTVIAQACRDDERLRFSYSAADGVETERLVEPHRLVSLGRRWYLVCWDVERADWRTFRVDRLREPRSTGTPFRQRPLPGEDAVAFVRSRLASVPMQHRVEVVFHVPYAELENASSDVGGTFSPIDESSTRMVMNVDELVWPAMVLTAMGHEFSVVSPPELEELVRSTAARFARAGDR
ncbi:helix-turn-helix transcriptional regulator [Tenggerimyces flavus]|uniref:Helix-turn-helix transcriptional regulator n=1 Tax=Tenggerimyces flavus TaxID=1708749 RepID=A0ABV7YES7_9ACTN|nr:YafY family protein [Tenggerimyces flavus]MBM7787993.1 putative DNA-binding transcriptional regulator YafY [Tenggerimyces flavus]